MGTNRACFPTVNELAYKAQAVALVRAVLLGSSFLRVEYFPPMQHNFRFYGCGQIAPLPRVRGRIIKALSEGEKGLSGWYRRRRRSYRQYADRGSRLPHGVGYRGRPNTLFRPAVRRQPALCRHLQNGTKSSICGPAARKSYSHDPDDEHSLPVACLRPFQERYRAWFSMPGNGQRLLL